MKQNENKARGMRLCLISLVVILLCGTGLYFGGIFNPCRKGHDYAAGVDNCICIECGVTAEHEFFPEEAGCTCVNCGFKFDEHIFAKQDNEYVCSNCGKRISSVEYLKKYIVENGQYDGEYYMIDAIVPFREIERIVTIGCRSVSDESIYFGWMSEFAGGYDIVSISMDTDSYRCTYAYESYLALALHKASGTFSASEYRKNQSLRPSSISGPYANEPYAKSTLEQGCSNYIGHCIAGLSDVLKEHNLDIKYEEIGFLEYR